MSIPSEPIIDSLLAQFRREQRAWRIRRAICLLGIATFVFWPFVTDWLPPRSHYLTSKIVFVLFAAAYGLLYWLPRRHRQAIEDSIHLADVHLAGPLAITLMQLETQHHGNLRRSVIIALTHMLGRLRSGDADLLTAPHRAALLKLLRAGSNIPVLQRDITDLAPNDIQPRNPDLSLAILSALEQIGDVGAIPDIERLAAKDAKTTAAMAVRDSARECLVSLRYRAEEEKARTTLLRPSAAADSALMRPVSDTGGTDETLLRPSAER